MPHDLYASSLEYVTEVQTKLTDFLEANLSKYSIYPIEGNHDFEKANSQDFTKPDPVLQVNLRLWNQYLDAEARQQYQTNGYYSQKLRLRDGTVYTKVNIVAVNS